MRGEPSKHVTEHELAVLRLVARGLTNKEIGAWLNMALSTTKNELTVIYRKIGLTERPTKRRDASRWLEQHDSGAQIPYP